MTSCISKCSVELGMIQLILGCGAHEWWGEAAMTRSTSADEGHARSDERVARWP